MLKSIRTRELYKFTLQQKAVQDILKAFSKPTTVLDLGNKAKLSQRGTYLLLDLIKTATVKKVIFCDCVLEERDIKRIAALLSNEANSIAFRKTTTLGIEGSVLIKAILRKQPVECFGMIECSLDKAQIRNIIEGLCLMKCTKVKEIDLRGNSIGSEGALLIRQLLLQKQVQKLLLPHCYVTALHLKSIAEGINKMPGMMDLIDLRGNLISKKDVEAFKKKIENKVVEVNFY